MGVPKIIILSEIMRGKSFDLTNTSYSIGRSEDREICIPDGTISTFHCEIVQNPDGTYEAHDKGSTNGTRINGIRISSERLCNGDILQCGGIELLFDSEEKANTTAITTQTSISLDEISGDFKIGDLKSISDVGNKSARKKGPWTIIIIILAVIAVALLGLTAKKFL